ncbi:MAG: HAMP domain-containing protein [Acidobacteria bacterium]|nr:HAMP domain-containing protein [Acidobacteriota bacterium]
MIDSVRARLTLWYVGVLALVLVGFSVAFYVLLARGLSDDLDDDLRVSLDTVTVSLARGLSAGEPLAGAAARAINELSTREATAIYDSSGRLIAEQPAQGGIRAPLPPAGALSEQGVYFGTVRQPGAGEEDARRRVAAQRAYVSAQGAPLIVVVSSSFESVTDGLGTVRDLLYVAVPVALLFSGLGGWFLARRSLAPAVEMAERARRIGAENLEQRLPVANPRDEIGRLAATFNELLGRLDESFSYQRRFMADASHELRTPLSVIRTATGVTLEREGRAAGEYQDALKIIDEQARRLTHIVEDMFTLARADVGQPGLNVCDFYLDELVTEVARAAEVLASRRGVRIEVAPAPETLFHGDEGLLRQMLLNLVDNAVKHTPPGGSVRIALALADHGCAITVADTGSGIPAAAQQHIFERFFRADKARSRVEAVGSESSGAGLGLSISQRIAEAHGGHVELRHSDVTGSTFVATLPLAGAR